MESSNSDCPYLEACPIFSRFRNESLGEVWIMYFCKGGQADECERRKLKEAGREVPLTLLPNGKHLPELAEEKDEDE